MKKKTSWTKDDERLWRAAMAGVKPVKGVRPKAGSHGAGAREIVAMPAAARRKEKKGRETDHATAERFRKGKMKIEARLDLHGYTLATAEKRVRRAVEEWRNLGVRCALIITGQGRGRAGANQEDWWAPRPGGLREELPGWLNKKPLADIVLLVSPAQPRDGGAGAFYVLFRRDR